MKGKVLDRKEIVKKTKEEIEKEREQEAIYINKTEITEKMINEFYKFYNKKINRLDFYSFLVCGIVLLVIAIFYLTRLNDYFLGIIWNIIINSILILVGIGFFISALKNQKYNKDKMSNIYDEDMSKMSNTYYFNDKKIIIINKFGETKRMYDYLTAIYEAKNYYYLFTNTKNAYIIRKDSFIKGSQYKFREFIKEKLGKAYKKRYVKK